MAKEFIEKKVGNRFLVEARRQQKQLAYFTQSVVQQDITQSYIDTWVQRNYSSNDDFLNWVKTVFKTDNFLSFFKYFRNPVASSRLVNDIIKSQLERVFFSEDAFFKYIIDGEEVPPPKELEVEKFNETIFNALLFRYNDILIADISGEGESFREIISINNVVAIAAKDSVIHKMAYAASFPVEKENGELEIIQGFVFMDDKQWILYDKEINPLKIIPHDLGECPADFIAREPFSDDGIVRKSIFSYVRADFEEYVFLKTLQKMTEPNGAIPIVTKLKTKEKTGTDQDIKGSSPKEPMTPLNISGQKAEWGKEVQSGGDVTQAGTIVNVPIIKKDDGSIDMEAVKNFLNFFWIPVESLKYINDRISQIEDTIVMTVLGDLADQTNERKNELQVKGGFVSAEDRIRGLSLQLSRVRTRSDFKMLALQLGPNRVFNEAFYGSDFFLESQSQLYDLFEKSPNPIERRNILIRMTKNESKFNPDKGQRQVILYHLLPYVADEDFQSAIDQFAVDPLTFQLQTRFNYWIGLFEATYGDILVFWNSMESSNSEKLIVINNLIKDLITKDKDVQKILSRAIMPPQPPQPAAN